jgi:putative ABC transport system permease protein
MKASLFLTYPLRSLWRGGGSIRLAILCIALGVMVVVAIESIGLMATNSYVQNARTANGGDLSITAGNRNTPLTQNDLSFFAQLQREHTISNYTPVNMAMGIALRQPNGALDTTPAPSNGLLVQIVDPHHFPLVGAPTFISPASGSLATLLTGNQVVVTQTFLTHYHKQIGDTFGLQLQSSLQSAAGRTLHVRLAGVIANTGRYPGGNTFVLISFAEYQAASPSDPLTYESVDITTPDQAHTDQAIRAVQQQVQQRHFPPIATQTVADLQQHLQVYNGQATHAQELAGLLALLIGGLGILNTMRVLLARRTVEIAMLKTAGYNRSTLALLFGIETGVLGLIGGILGTGAAMAVSYGVVTTLLIVPVPFQPDPWILGGGIALGTVTALSFGLLPIVQSANIRPIQVLRERTDSGSGSSHISTMALYGAVALFFSLLASSILQNVVLAGASICGTVLFLAILGLCFRPIIWGISAFPIPEYYSVRYLTLALSCVILSAILGVFLPAIGGMALALFCLALVVRWLPHNWKMTTRMALRNLGRRPMRTTMLLLILFVGVFVIGSMQVIEQDLQSQLATTLNQTLSYNVITQVPQNQARAMQAQLTTLPGLLSSHTTTIAATTLVAINGQPWQSFLAPAQKNLTSETLTPQVQILQNFDGVEGYDLANQQVPDPQAFQIVAGRNLQASDAGTNHVLIPSVPALMRTFPLTVGNTVTVASVDGKISTPLMVVGEYTTAGLSLTHVSPIVSPQNIVGTLTPTFEQVQTIFYLKVDAAHVTQAKTIIGNAVSDASFVQTPVSRIDDYLQGISSIAWVFTVIAFFVLLAGMVVMANAVILDLEGRRRELGILKAIGYTQWTIQGELLLEYGIIGGTGAALAVFLITLLANFLGNTFLRATFSSLMTPGATLAFSFRPNGWLLASLVAGAILLVVITSLLASWRTLRIRPLDVLRYE